MTDPATHSSSTRRRRRISRDEFIAIVAVAIAAALAAMYRAPRPTAWRPSDLTLSAAFVALVAWAAATAPWWLLGLAGGVGAVFASPPWLFAGIVGCAIALLIGARLSAWPVARAASGALGATSLLHLGRWWFHGSTAVVAGGLGASIVWLGLKRRSRRTRWRFRRVSLVVGTVLGLVVIGALISAVRGASAMRQTAGQLRQAAAALKAGDFGAAGALIEQASGGLRRADAALHSPIAAPSLAVPLVGQHVASMRELVNAAAELTRVGGTSVTQIDVNALAVNDGVVDLDAVRLLREPVRVTNEAVSRLGQRLEASKSGWLIGPLGDRLQRWSGDVQRAVRQLGIADAALELAPSLLGTDGPRTYFVAFTTPAEARGIGGFMATWAELHIDDGRVEVTRTGSTVDLTTASTRPSLRMTDEFYERYGPFGGGSPTEPVAVDYWSNVTMSADFPTVAEQIRQLYPASGGRQLDGVLAMDIFAVARFLELTGPIRADGLGQAISSENAVDYLLRGQYEQFADDDTRDAVLSSLTDRLIREVFSSSLAGPRVMAEVVAPAITQRRLLMWSFHPEDQPGLRRIGLDGGLAETGAGRDGVEVAVNNAGGNKLDAYLRRQTVYHVDIDRANRRFTSQLQVTLSNTVTEPERLSPYAVGNRAGRPIGTNLSYVSIYSMAELSAAALDGQPLPVSRQRERGWNIYSAYLAIPPGGESVLRLDFVGPLASDGSFRLRLVSSPGAIPETALVRIVDARRGVRLERYSVLEGAEDFVVAE